MELTERALELLVPIIGDRMKLLAKLVKFQKEAKAGVASEEFDSAPVPTLLEERTLLCKETSTAPISVSKRQSLQSVGPADTVILNSKRPWPSVIELPRNLRPDLLEALLDKSGSKMTKKLRNAFIARIYEHFSQYTLYPTRIQLLEIAQLVVKSIHS